MLLLLLSYVKRFFVRLLKSVFIMGVPIGSTIVFALFLVDSFPNLPMWLIPIFFIHIAYFFTKFIK